MSWFGAAPQNPPYATARMPWRGAPGSPTLGGLFGQTRKSALKPPTGFTPQPLKPITGGPAPQMQSLTPSGVEQITTTVTPQPVYSDMDTARAQNQALNMGQTAAASAWRGMALPGISAASPGMLARGVPAAANAIGAAASTAEQLGLADRSANIANILAGEIGRAKDFANQVGLRGGIESAENAARTESAGIGAMGTLASAQNMRKLLLEDLNDRQMQQSIGRRQQTLNLQQLLDEAAMVNHPMFTGYDDELLNSMMWG